MRWCTYLLTYLHSWFGAYKTGNISETVEDKARKLPLQLLSYSLQDTVQVRATHIQCTRWPVSGVHQGHRGTG